MIKAYAATRSRGASYYRPLLRDVRESLAES